MTPRFLLVPMAAMAETAGSFSRVRLLALSLRERDIAVATCCAHDPNYREITGIDNYPLDVPSPLGLPAWYARYMFPLAQKLGITAAKEVHSFEEVQHLTGNTDYRYLRRSVEQIRDAIRRFRPTVVYSEFNLSAYIAARAEGITIYSTASVPTEPSFATSPQYARGVNRLLREMQLPPVVSVLDLFSWAEKRFVPSCPSLEVFDNKPYTYCGALRHVDFLPKQRNAVVVYMGNGTISPKKMLREVSEAFQHSDLQVYIAGKSLQTADMNNIHTAPRFDFSQLLPQAALMIHHGGQNSMIDALLYGVPQIICPGRVFERKYNADMLARNGAGLVLPFDRFSAAEIQQLSEQIRQSSSFAQQAERLRRELLALPGLNAIS
ncbi:MAG: hypothetical protein K6A36_00550 [Paludibacteraceae bacterium]|nr:hypothetical protein [Paludibacteraceae bacterium]